MKALIKRDLILSRYYIVMILIYFPFLLLALGISISITKDVIIANAFFISFIVLSFLGVYFDLFGKDNGTTTYMMIFSLPLDKSRFVLSRYASIGVISVIVSILYYGLFIGLSLNHSNLMAGQKIVFDIVPVSIAICIILASFILPFDFRRSFYAGIKKQGTIYIIAAAFLLILLMYIPFGITRISENMLIINILKNNIRLSSYIFMVLAMILYFASYRISKFLFDKANMITDL